MFKENRITFKEVPDRPESQVSRVSGDIFDDVTMPDAEDEQGLNEPEVNETKGGVDEPEGAQNQIANSRIERTNLSGDLANMIEREQNKGDKTLEAMRVLGISQEKLDEIFSDGTNPYVNWMIDFLGTFNKNGLVLDKGDTRRSGRFTFRNRGQGMQFYVANLDRAFMWKDRIYPALVKIVGAGNYSKYERAIWTATEENAPKMDKWIREVCGGSAGLHSRYLRFANVDRSLPVAVKAELDQLRRGKTVAQLKNEEAINSTATRGGRNEPISIENRMALEAYLNSNVEATTDESRTNLAQMEALRKAKYGNIIEEQKALVQRRMNDVHDLSSEDYAEINTGLDRLLDDTIDKIEDPAIRKLNDGVLQSMSVAEKMMADGATQSEIEAYFDESGINDEYDELNEASDSIDLDMVSDLWTDKLDAMATYYKVEKDEE